MGSVAQTYLTGLWRSGCYVLNGKNTAVDMAQAQGDYSLARKTDAGQPGWLSGLALPSAQGLILETQN